MAHLKWIFPLKMVIFHGYVSLPEGIHQLNGMRRGRSQQKLLDLTKNLNKEMINLKVKHKHT